MKGAKPPFQEYWGGYSPPLVPTPMVATHESRQVNPGQLAGPLASLATLFGQYTERQHLTHEVITGGRTCGQSLSKVGAKS